MDGFTWLQHADHGGTFQCPDAVLGEMKKLGWSPCDPPEVLDPAMVEHRIQEQARQEAVAASAVAVKEIKPTKAAVSGESKEE